MRKERLDIRFSCDESLDFEDANTGLCIFQRNGFIAWFRRSEFFGSPALPTTFTAPISSIDIVRSPHMMQISRHEEIGTEAQSVAAAVLALREVRHSVVRRYDPEICLDSPIRPTDRRFSAASRFLYVDSICGLAALGVVYFHMAQVFVSNPATMAGFERAMMVAATSYVDLGKLCVILFFFVSGMVIPNSLLRPAAYPIRDFVIGRVFRLYPAYWLSIPAGVIAWWVAGESVPFHVFVSNITMLQQFVGIGNIIGVYWTLQIELIFYGLCVLLLLVKVLDRSVAILAGIVRCC